MEGVRQENICGACPVMDSGLLHELPHGRQEQKQHGGVPEADGIIPGGQ
ncbi:hypothetical protein [Viscerimonas tarda]